MKALGILLLILLILILTIVCILLFVPIRWEVGAKAAQLPLSSFRAFMKVRWLAGAVCFQARATENVIALRLKLFGRVIRKTAFHWRYPFAEEQVEATEQREREEPPGRENVRKSPAESVKPEAKTSSVPVKTAEPKRISKAGKKSEPKKKPEAGKSPEPGKTAAERASGRVSESSESAEPQEESLSGCVKALWDASHRPEHARMLGLVREQISRIRHHLRPQTVRVHAIVGFADPAVTGELLGVFYSLWPLFANAGDFRLMGDFERKTLEGKLYLKGRIRSAVCVSAVFRLFLDKEIRRLVISYFKQ